PPPSSPPCPSTTLFRSQMLAIQPDDEVLEIGTGSGFLTACLARLGRTVTSVDIFPDFPETAAPKLKRAGIDNVTLAMMDATRERSEEHTSELSHVKISY